MTTRREVERAALGHPSVAVDWEIRWRRPDGEPGILAYRSVVEAEQVAKGVRRSGNRPTIEPYFYDPATGGALDRADALLLLFGPDA